MAEVTLYAASGEAGGTTTLSDAVFGGRPNKALLHQAVVRQQANARQGTHDTKTRGELTYTTAKAYRQKGTGRARQGARKMGPHWRGGGVAFGPHPRSYRQEMPKKMRVAALRSALAAKATSGELVVMQALTMDAPSTKTLAALLRKVVPGYTTLLVLDTPHRAVQLSARNLPFVKTITTDNVNVLDVLRHQRVVLTQAAVRVLEERYGGDTESEAAAAAPAAAEAPAAEQAPQPARRTRRKAADETPVASAAEAPSAEAAPPETVPAAETAPAAEEAPKRAPRRRAAKTAANEGAEE